MTVGRNGVNLGNTNIRSDDLCIDLPWPALGLHHNASQYHPTLLRSRGAFLGDSLGLVKRIGVLHPFSGDKARFTLSRSEILIAGGTAKGSLGAHKRHPAA